MSSRRVANRYRLVLLLGLVIALALGSFWLLQLMRKGVISNAPDARGNAPDYYVENFNFVRMSKVGEARYTVTGKRMIHRPQDDTYEITQPLIYSLSQDQPPLMMRAERAIAVPDTSKIHMIDKVEADRPASAKSAHFHMKSDYALILPDEDVIQTDKPVQLTLGSAILTGTGMVANNATRELRLAQRVHGTFPPRPAAGARP